ncbi:hypothetical protein [Rhizobium sp. MHM7A]|uniref:hypothetical protein n=1 Tax=Rhizobium sp. MHM7A TaxID=2583233 RepID=UPI0011062FAE|nr:hypothetical protein [Rhizobium sp. MHM7A]TLX16136.1 hypothetical protein FFR93_02085 [Rhizobium sp. MHM7A]
MQNFARLLSNQEIIDVIQALDRINNPLVRRMEGDDDAIVNLMKKLSMPQTLAEKLLVGYVVAREAASRGLQIARPNDPASTTEHEEDFSPGLGRR